MSHQSLIVTTHSGPAFTIDLNKRSDSYGSGCRYNAVNDILDAKGFWTDDQKTFVPYHSIDRIRYEISDRRD